MQMPYFVCCDSVLQIALETCSWFAVSLVQAGGTKFYFIPCSTKMLMNIAMTESYK